MGQVEPIPADRKGVIPHLIIKNASEALEYYAKAFDAEVLATFPGPDGRLMHSEIQIGESVLYVTDDFPEMMDGKGSSPSALGGSSVVLHRYVEDTDAALAKAEAAGGTISMPAEDMFWGDRYGQVIDPYGHTWTFATHIKDMTEEELDAARDSFNTG